MLRVTQSGRHPAAARNRRSTSRPCSVCSTSGWNCTPYSPRSGSSIAATGVAAVRAVTAKPGGATVPVSPCDIQTCCGERADRPAASARPGGRLRPGRAPGGGSNSSEVAPYSPAPVRATARPARTPELEAVADAEHRHPGGEQAIRRGGRARGVDRGRAAGQDDRLGLAGQDLCRRHRGRHDLRVHVALAHPPGDQLRVLCAEVHHQHGVEVTSVHDVAFPGSPPHPLPDGAATTRSLLAVFLIRRGPGGTRRAGWAGCRRPGPPGPARRAGRPAWSR